MGASPISLTGLLLLWSIILSAAPTLKPRLTHKGSTQLIPDPSGQPLFPSQLILLFSLTPKSIHPVRNSSWGIFYNIYPIATLLCCFHCCFTRRLPTLIILCLLSCNYLRLQLISLFSVYLHWGFFFQCIHVFIVIAFLLFLLKDNWFTMLCWFLVYSKVIQLYTQTHICIYSSSDSFPLWVITRFLI